MTLSRRTLLAALGLITVAVLVVPGVGAEEPVAEPDAAVAPSPDAAVAPSPDAAVAPSSEPDAPDSAPPGDGAGLGTPEPVVSVSAVPTSPTARVRSISATLWIRSFTPEQTLAACTRKLEELGGYVQESSNERAAFKLPAGQLDAAQRALRDIGEVVDERVDSEDVTLEIATLNAQIHELRASRGRIMVMLSSTASVPDALAVEKDLHGVTAELEDLEGRLRFLDSRSEWVPLTLHVSMQARPQAKPIKIQPFPWVAAYGLEELLSERRNR